MGDIEWITELMRTSDSVSEAMIKFTNSTKAFQAFTDALRKSETLDEMKLRIETEEDDNAE